MVVNWKLVWDKDNVGHMSIPAKRFFITIVFNHPRSHITAVKKIKIKNNPELLHYAVLQKCWFCLLAFPDESLFVMIHKFCVYIKPLLRICITDFGLIETVATVLKTHSALSFASFNPQIQTLLPNLNFMENTRSESVSLKI